MKAVEVLFFILFFTIFGVIAAFFLLPNNKEKSTVSAIDDDDFDSDKSKLFENCPAKAASDQILYYDSSDNY